MSGWVLLPAAELWKGNLEFIENKRHDPTKLLNINTGKNSSNLEYRSCLHTLLIYNKFPWKIVSSSSKRSPSCWNALMRLY